MTKVFVGGSRKISRLSPEVQRRLDEIIARGHQVLVGDANGADRAVQAYLHGRGYSLVVVFCTGGTCRNNVGGWHVDVVAAPHATKDFSFYTAKDAAMAEIADAALMLWEGSSSGTIVNVARMLAAGKPSVVWVANLHRFHTIKAPSDLEALLAAAPDETRAKVERYVTGNAAEPEQRSIFGSAA